jgi:transmembrane sensor
MENLFRKYLNGTCNPDEFNEVLNLLGTKGNNDKLSSLFDKCWRDVLLEDNDGRQNDQLLDKIHHRIALEESTINARRFVIARNLLRFAAILIVGLIISSVFIYNRSKTRIYSDIVENIKTPYGARTSFKLPDGSDVWLNSASALSFQKQFGRIREVKLSGQAYFDVIKDGKPFVVKTRYGNIEVKGTSFDVKAFDDEDFETTLVEGIVKIRNIKDQVITLKPGQQSIINPDNEFEIMDVKTDLFTSWKDGKLIFVNEPFQKVARALEKWYNVKIEIKDEKLKNLGYTGKIELETFSEVLDLINITTPLKYKFDKNTRILKIYSR